MLLLGWLVIEPVHAHRLTVNWEVRDGRLVIEADSEEEPAAGADVEVRSAADEVLATGFLNDRGIWEWPLSGAGDLTVVVDAGLGHRRTLNLTVEQLRPSVNEANRSVADSTPSASVVESGAILSRGSADGTGWLGWRVVLGLTFLLATASAWMSWRNLRRVDELERRWKEHESRS